MKLSNFFSEKEQDDFLYVLVTESLFTDADFYEMLKEGFLLTPRVVLLAHLRGKDWLLACLGATSFPEESAKLCNKLFSDKLPFISSCLGGAVTSKGMSLPPNYLMAHAIAPEGTLLYMGSVELWDKIYNDILQSDNISSEVAAEVRSYLKKYAPKDWHKKNNV